VIVVEEKAEEWQWVEEEVSCARCYEVNGDVCKVLAGSVPRELMDE